MAHALRAAQAAPPKPLRVGGAPRQNPARDPLFVAQKPQVQILIWSRKPHPASPHCVAAENPLFRITPNLAPLRRGLFFVKPITGTVTELSGRLHPSRPARPRRPFLAARDCTVPSDARTEPASKHAPSIRPVRPRRRQDHSWCRAGGNRLEV
jgi:hypothetical protein